MNRVLFFILALLTARSSFSKDNLFDSQVVMSSEKIKTQFAFLQKCSFKNELSLKTKKIIFIGVWCDGENKANFFDLDEDSYVEKIEQRQKDEWLIWEDRNNDHRFDFASSSTYTSRLIKTIEKKDENFDGIVGSEVAYEDSIYQQSSCQRNQGMNLSELAQHRFVLTANSWVNSSCPANIPSLIHSSLKTGLLCLAKLGTNQALAYKAKIENITRYQNSAILFNCTYAKEYAGQAVLVSNARKINLSLLHIDRKGQSNPKNVIFHEFLHHALDLPHNHQSSPPRLNVIDPVIACEVCCGEGYTGYIPNSDPSVKERACGFCSGKDKDIRKYQIFMADYGNSEVKKLYRQFATPKKADTSRKKVDASIKESKRVSALEAEYNNNFGVSPNPACEKLFKLYPDKKYPEAYAYLGYRCSP